MKFYKREERMYGFDSFDAFAKISFDTLKNMCYTILNNVI